MLNNAYLYYILSMYTGLISKTLHLCQKQSGFSCGYVSCTNIEDFTAWCVLIQMNPFFH